MRPKQRTALSRRDHMAFAALRLGFELNVFVRCRRGLCGERARCQTISMLPVASVDVVPSGVMWIRSAGAS